MNSSTPADKGLDPATVNIIGWMAVLIFVVCISIFIYRLQHLLNSDLGGLKSVRII